MRRPKNARRYSPPARTIAGPRPDHCGISSAHGTREIVETCWKSIPSHHPHVTLDAWVVMPDHLHGDLVVQSADFADGNGLRGGGPDADRAGRQEVTSVAFRSAKGRSFAERKTTFIKLAHYPPPSIPCRSPSVSYNRLFA